MFQIPWQLSILFLGVFLLTMFILGLVIGLVLNSVFRAPFRDQIVSSGLVAIISSLGTVAIIIFVPGAISSFNGEAQSLKAMMWSYSLVICGAAAMLSVLVWQLVVRRLRSQYHSR